MDSDDRNNSNILGAYVGAALLFGLIATLVGFFGLLALSMGGFIGEITLAKVLSCTVFGALVGVLNLTFERDRPEAACPSILRDAIWAPMLAKYIWVSTRAGEIATSDGVV